jgi:predicted metal-dependent HD superfamily phosphohydrolase
MTQIDPFELSRLLRPWAVVPAAADALAAELLDRYGERHRRYHTVEHLADVLAELDRLAHWVPAAEAPEVRLAAWFHDAVYDPTAGAGESEEASARLAVDWLTTLCVPASVGDEVGRLVRLTAGHDVDEGDAPGAALIDADLAILAVDPTRYSHYVHRVRAEYRHVPDDLWRTGRAGVLRRFADADRLFHVVIPDDHRDQRARRNLRRELASLEPTQPAPGRRT